MTQLLERALSQVAGLTESDQDSIAALILEELADERRWESSFAKSPDVLGRLAQEALADYKAGKTRILNVDEL